MPSIAQAIVLLVQVDIDCGPMYAKVLRRHGLLPVPIATATVALSVAPRADVIVTETLLPGPIDGIELIRRLKRGERTKTIPVIVLTVCAWPAERERAENAGCDVFLAKPCLPDTLVREVRRVLAPRRSRRR